MNIQQKLRHAHQNELPVKAWVRLYDGQRRVRLGFVTSVKHDHVIIYDVNKGFRTTPLPFVHRVQLLPNPTK